MDGAERLERAILVAAGEANQGEVRDRPAEHGTADPHLTRCLESRFELTTGFDEVVGFVAHDAEDDARGRPRLDDRHPEDRAWSEGNLVRPLIHGATYFAELYAEHAFGRDTLVARMRAMRTLLLADKDVVLVSGAEANEKAQASLFETDEKKVLADA